MLIEPFELVPNQAERQNTREMSGRFGLFPPPPLSVSVHTSSDKFKLPYAVNICGI